jgi:hypothetical protein
VCDSDVMSSSPATTRVGVVMAARSRAGCRRRYSQQRELVYRRGVRSSLPFRRP